METLARMTNAPVERDCNGQNVLLYGLRFIDWGVLEQWMRSRVVMTAIEAVRTTPDLPSDLRQDLLDSAYEESTKISIGSCFMGKGNITKEGDKIVISGSGKTMAFLRTFEGMLRVVQLSLRDGPGKDGKPIFKLEEVGELLGNDHDLLADLFGVAFDLSFPAKEKTGEVKDDPKNQMETETKPHPTS